MIKYIPCERDEISSQFYIMIIELKVPHGYSKISFYVMVKIKRRKLLRLSSCTSLEVSKAAFRRRYMNA